MVPLLDLKAEYDFLEPNLLASVHHVMKSGSYVLGDQGKALEVRMSEYVGVSHAVGVANGTDALYLALRAIGIEPGDEVITTPFTFFATAEMIARIGAKPVFVDIDLNTYNLDPAHIEQVITTKTKAILVVHLFGHCAEMQSIVEIANRHHLKVVEDACQAIGATCHGMQAGSMGHIGCFSFYPTKNLGAFGDAGMVVTSDGEAAERMAMLRNHGSVERYVHQDIGINSRLDEIQAAILLVKFDMLENWTDRRIASARRYHACLGDDYSVPMIRPGFKHVFHQYCIRAKDRPRLRRYLSDLGISTGVYYPVPLHLQPAFLHLGHQTGDFPMAERAAQEILALPIFPFMLDDQQDEVIRALRAFACMRDES